MIEDHRHPPPPVDLKGPERLFKESANRALWGYQKVRVQDTTSDGGGAPLPLPHIVSSPCTHNVSSPPVVTARCLPGPSGGLGGQGSRVSGMGSGQTSLTMTGVWRRCWCSPLPDARWSDVFADVAWRERERSGLHRRTPPSPLR